MSVQQKRLEIDSSVRRSSHGTALIGGSPFRVIRLSRSGAQLLDAWLAGEPTERSDEADALRTRLIEAGLLHPVPSAEIEPPSFAVVVPVFNDAVGLRELLSAVRSEFADIEIVVVDDASSNPDAIDEIAGRAGAELLRQPHNQGPAAARNAGWKWLASTPVTVEIVMFLDSDVVPTPRALRTLLAHFDDDVVDAAAPRVMARPGFAMLAKHEACKSPLDLGAGAARVRPRTRISYVPSAALAVRMETLAEHDGFDEAMRVGEDVDFVWRIAVGPRQVRFAPSAVVHHRNRPTLRAMVKQRFGYGSSAAALAARHRGDVAPIEAPAPAMAIWLAAFSPSRWARVAALGSAAYGTWSLSRKLDAKVDDPAQESLRLSWLTHVHGIRTLASAARRAWLPLLMWLPHTRRLLRIAFVVPPLIEWVRNRPANDPITHVAVSALDDVSYCAGVWSGVFSHRSIAALIPRLTR